MEVDTVNDSSTKLMFTKCYNSEEDNTKRNIMSLGTFDE